MAPEKNRGCMKNVIMALLLWLAATAAAMEPLLVNQDRFRINILPYAEYLTDETNQYSVHQLQQEGLANRFTPVHTRLLRNGYFDGSVWLRLNLTNPTGQPGEYRFLVESHANHLIDIYALNPDAPNGIQNFSLVRSGAAIPLNKRPEPLGNFVLPVRLAPGTQTLYFKLQSMDPLNTRVILMDHRTLHLTLAKSIGVHAALLSLQILLLGLAVIALVRYRHAALVWACVLNLGLIGFNAGWNGMVSFLLPALGYIDIHARNVGGLLTLLALAGIIATFHQDRFPVWLRETLRWSLRALAALCAVAVVPIALKITPLLFVLIPVVLLLIGVLWFYQREPEARYEFWGLLGYVSAVILFLMIVIAGLGLMVNLSLNSILLHIMALGSMAATTWAAYSFARHKNARVAVDGLNLPSLHWPLLRKLNHEMRGPINGVLGMTELLQDTSLSAHQQEYVNTVQAAGFSLLRQADQLQNLVRIGLNRLPDGEDEFDLYDLLEDAIQPYSRLAHAKQLELVMDVAPELPTRYRGNAQIIAQIISNLLDNALNYTDNGEVLIQVKPWNNQRIRFSVTDTGPGLPKEYKNTLFDFPQAQTEDQLAPRDVHLGLPITRVLVGLLGGQLSFSSELRMGTTFWIDLPLAEVPDAGEIDAYSTQDLDQIRLMVIDDNLTCRKVIEHLGMSWGMNVFSMSNGQSALANLHNEYHKGTPVDVLVLDQNMPGMTGTELAERIRSDEALNKDILIIMLTGIDVGHVDLDESRLNIQYLLTKPVSGRALKQTLMQAMPDIQKNREHHHAKKSFFF